MRGIIFIALIGAFASGCASMSPEQCASADWRSIGYADGAGGRSMDAANDRGAACHGHGYALNHDAYREGREAGLAEFCTIGNAYGVGLRGQTYGGVCVNHDEAAFVAAYDEGREHHRYASAVSEARARISTLERKISDSRKNIRALQDEFRSGVSQERYDAAKQQLLYAQVETERLERNELPDARAALIVAERELDRLTYEKSVRAQYARQAVSPTNAAATAGGETSLEDLINNRDRAAETPAEAHILDLLEKAQAKSRKR